MKRELREWGTLYLPLWSLRQLIFQKFWNMRQTLATSASFIGYSLHSSCHLLLTQTSPAKEADGGPSWHQHTSLYNVVGIGMGDGRSDWNPQQGTSGSVPAEISPDLSMRPCPWSWEVNWRSPIPIVQILGSSGSSSLQSSLRPKMHIDRSVVRLCTPHHKNSRTHAHTCSCYACKQVWSCLNKPKCQPWAHSVYPVQMKNKQWNECWWRIETCRIKV